MKVQCPVENFTKSAALTLQDRFSRTCPHPSDWTLLTRATWMSFTQMPVPCQLLVWEYGGRVAMWTSTPMEDQGSLNAAILLLGQLDKVSLEEHHE